MFYAFIGLFLDAMDKIDELIFEDLVRLVIKGFKALAVSVVTFIVYACAVLAGLLCLAIILKLSLSGSP